MFFLESTESEQVLKASVASAFNASNSATLEEKRVVNSSTIKVFTSDGTNTTARDIKSYDDFVNWIRDGGFSPNSPGAVISYTLRNAMDFSRYALHLTSTYDIQTCTTGTNTGPLTGSVKPQLQFVPKKRSLASNR